MVIVHGGGRFDCCRATRVHATVPVVIPWLDRSTTLRRPGFVRTTTTTNANGTRAVMLARIATSSETRRGAYAFFCTRAWNMWRNDGNRTTGSLENRREIARRVGRNTPREFVPPRVFERRYGVFVKRPTRNGAGRVERHIYNIYLQAVYYDVRAEIADEKLSHLSGMLNNILSVTYRILPIFTHYFGNYNSLLPHLPKMSTICFLFFVYCRTHSFYT